MFRLGYWLSAVYLRRTIRFRFVIANLIKLLNLNIDLLFISTIYNLYLTDRDHREIDRYATELRQLPK